MDLESESSVPEYVEDNQVGGVSHVEDKDIRNNGSCAIETGKLVSVENLADTGENDLDSAHRLNSPSRDSKSPSGVSPSTRKGYGLKKWRRIRRDFTKDANATNVDTSKILKRGLSGPGNSIKPQRSTLETMHNSEGSVGSANLLKNVGTVSGFSIRSSGSDPRFAAGSVFAAGTDSENSEDRSSKSSTAASAPKARYDLPAVSGHVREKNRMKNIGGKNLGNLTQRVPQGKGKTESSKKHRGERVKIEKKDSHSSMESDSRSSNIFFMQGATLGSNGKQTGRSMSYDGENSDEAHVSEQHLSEEVQTGYSKLNVGEVEDFSQDDLAADLSWGVKGEKSEINRFSNDQDPLVKSILSLQSVQEALEKEVQKLGEIGKEPLSPPYNSVDGGGVPADFTDPEICEPNTSDQLGSENIRLNAVSSLEVRVLILKQNIKCLETKLDEARAMLEVKSFKVAELEATINSSKSPKEESGSTTEIREEKYKEMESELESLFKQRIEAEVEYLAITRPLQRLKVAANKRITLSEERETLAEEQAQMLNKLGETESKATRLKKRAEELEKYCGDFLGAEEVLVMQRSVCKVTSCFVIQFLLLVLVLWIFVLQLSPHSEAVVPT